MDIKLIQQELNSIKQDIKKAIDEIDEHKNQIKLIQRNSRVVGLIFTGVIITLSTLLIITILRG